MKPLSIAEQNLVVSAIDNWLYWSQEIDVWFTCVSFDDVDNRDWVTDSEGGECSQLRKRYADFYDQSDSDYWFLGESIAEQNNARAMLLATFLVLKGVVPGGET